MACAAGRGYPLRDGRSSPYGGRQLPGRADTRQVALNRLLRSVQEKCANLSEQEIVSLEHSLATFLPDAGATKAVGAPGPPIGSGEYSGNTPFAKGSSQGSDWSSLPTLSEFVGDLTAVKVAPKTNVKSIAGSIAKCLRGAEALVATAVGPEGLNHGVKAFCISRCYLAAEGLDLNISVAEARPDTNVSQDRAYAFLVQRMQVPPAAAGPMCAAGVGRADPLPRQARSPGQQTAMKVAAGGAIAPVAGAIAKCLRDDKEAVISAIGPVSVAKCMEALALASTYLRKESMELFFFPNFENVLLGPVSEKRGGPPGATPGNAEERCCVVVHAWRETSWEHSPNAGQEASPLAVTL